MTDEEMAKEYIAEYGFGSDCNNLTSYDANQSIEQAFLAGLKAGRKAEREYATNNIFTTMKEQGFFPVGKWHKIFDGEPCYTECLDLPQNRLPEIMNFYFVKLKNGTIKICELRYDHLNWNGKKCFYDLHGAKQSNVVAWLDYPEQCRL